MVLQQRSLGLNPSFCFYAGYGSLRDHLVILTESIQEGFAVVAESNLV